MPHTVHFEQHRFEAGTKKITMVFKNEKDAYHAYERRATLIKLNKFKKQTKLVKTPKEVAKKKKNQLRKHLKERAK